VRSSRGREQALAWMAILILATLRSPFLPLGYGAFPALWLLTLLGAIYAPTVRTIAWILLPWIALAIALPIDWPMDPRLLASVSLLPMAVTVLVAARALRNALQRSTLVTPFSAV
jgi:alpha-1,2-mannosyltransferase